VIFSAALLRLLPLQLGFERFQYISLNLHFFAKIKSQLKYAALINMSFNVLVKMVTKFLAQ